jgi:large subunit ribosomal protein L19
MTNIIDEINAEQLNNDLPKFSPGDTIIVSVKVKEGNRERLQAFEGVCIAMRNRGLKLYFLRDREGRSARIKEKLG